MNVASAPRARPRCSAGNAFVRIAGAPDAEEQRADHEEVDGRHPLDGRHARVQLAAQQREDGVDNAGVEAGHERAHADGREHGPAAVGHEVISLLGFIATRGKALMTASSNVANGRDSRSASSTKSASYAVMPEA